MVVDEAAGAAGAAGVWAAAGAGVEGGALLDEAADGLGCESVSHRICDYTSTTNLGHHADNEALLLDAVCFYRVRILQNLACPNRQQQ